METKSKKHALPNADLVQDAYVTFVNLANKMTELNNFYLSQAKNFFQVSITNSQKLYEVSTPEELIQGINVFVNDNGALVAKTFLEDLNVRLKMLHDLCGSSAGGVDHACTHSIKVFDFYSKLIPSPLVYKLDDAVKNAAAGNHEAICTLQSVVQNALEEGLKNLQK